MARSRLFAGCLLITRIFIFLLICLDERKAAMVFQDANVQVIPVRILNPHRFQADG
jgi:hypothetical protein